MVALCGIVFQTVYSDTAPIYIFLLRVGLAGAGSLLYKKALEGRNPIVDWLSWATGVLALSQLAPISWLNLGMVAAGLLLTCAPFPAAALAGLALDLAQITPVPMTAVMTLG